MKIEKKLPTVKDQRKSKEEELSHTLTPTLALTHTQGQMDDTTTIVMMMMMEYNVLCRYNVESQCVFQS